MSISKQNIIGAGIGIVIIIASLVMFLLKVPIMDSKTFYFICGVAIIIMSLPFFSHLLLEGKKEKEKEAMFLEFARDLVEGVKSGTPISKSILNVKNKNYGCLNSHIFKLANQISLGIPVKDALDIFSKDLKNEVITRSVGLIREAERSGGRIELVLESVTFSVSQIEKLKKERKAAIYNLTVQGYIIFLIFIFIMLVMQFKILPIATGLGSLSSSSELGSLGGGMGGGKEIDPEKLGSTFLYLLLVQGFFAGLVIGKLAEGNIKSGLKHSFILLSISWVISQGANVLLK